LNIFLGRGNSSLFLLWLSLLWGFSCWLWSLGSWSTLWSSSWLLSNLDQIWASPKLLGCVGVSFTQQVVIGSASHMLENSIGLSSVLCVSGSHISSLGSLESLLLGHNGRSLVSVLFENFSRVIWAWFSRRGDSSQSLFVFVVVMVVSLLFLGEILLS